MWYCCHVNPESNPMVNLDHVIAIERYQETVEGTSYYYIGFHKPMGYIEWSYKKKADRDSRHEQLKEKLIGK